MKSKLRSATGLPLPKKKRNRDKLATRITTSRTEKRPDGTIKGRVNVTDINDGKSIHIHNDNWSDPGWGNGGHQKRRYIRDTRFANPIKHKPKNSGAKRKTHRTGDTRKSPNMGRVNLRSSHEDSKKRLRNSTYFNVD